ncbi:MAG: hypothetical protein ABID38_02890 [Candidatus Diapherotrites archaeon]
MRKIALILVIFCVLLSGCHRNLRENCREILSWNMGVGLINSKIGEEAFSFNDLTG